MDRWVNQGSVTRSLVFEKNEDKYPQWMGDAGTCSDITMTIRGKPNRNGCSGLVSQIAIPDQLNSRVSPD